MTAILAWTNYTKTATLTTPSAAANMPFTNMANDQGSSASGWQTVYGVKTTAAGAYFKVTPATGGQTWRAAGLFGTNITAAGVVTFKLVNSPGTVIWSKAVSPVAGYKQVVAVVPSDMTADWLEVDIDDTNNPDGFINVPLVFAGPAWLPMGATSYASTVGRDDATAEVVSRGGQEYPTLLWQRRRWNVVLDSIRAAETWAQADALGGYAKGGSNVLFVPCTTSAYLQQEAIFGRLKATADLSYPYQGADRRRWQFQITERL